MERGEKWRDCFFGKESSCSSRKMLPENGTQDKCMYTEPNSHALSTHSEAKGMIDGMGCQKLSS